MPFETTAGAGLAESVKSWLTWFAGAVAGVTALLYAAGYLSLRAHANLLGLTGFVQFDHDELLQEGARFFLVAATAVGQALLSASVALVVLMLVVLALRWVARRVFTYLHEPAARANAWSSRLRWLALFAVGALFLWSLWDTLGRLRDPLCVANVLFATPDLSACPTGFDGAALIGKLRDGASRSMQAEFADLLFSGLGHALFLASVAAWLARPLAARRWIVMPFAVAIVLMLFMLPMVYGVMVKPVRFPRVALSFTDDAGKSVEQLLYLVRRDDQSLVVWDAQRRTLVWWPLSLIRKAEVEAVENPLASLGGAKP